jgi:hypothetical protein
MKKLLPSRLECFELLALTGMLVGVQWVLASWGWTALFALGFLWNWAILNGWAQKKVTEKRYRFSLLRFAVLVEQLLKRPLRRWPWIAWITSIWPAGLVMALVAYSLEASIPWWAAFLGSGAFLLVRSQIAMLLRHEKL